MRRCVNRAPIVCIFCIVCGPVATWLLPGKVRTPQSAPGCAAQTPEARLVKREGIGTDFFGSESRYEAEQRSASVCAPFLSGAIKRTVYGSQKPIWEPPYGMLIEPVKDVRFA